MGISIHKNGIQTTIQDLGRNGYRKFGINPNGAMDQTALRLANVLLGNSENEAGLEIYFPAPVIKFGKNAIFVLSGAEFSATLNDSPIQNWKIQLAKKGDTLKFTKRIKGNICYLLVKGGFKVDKWLESSSTSLTAEIGGLEGRKLKTGDEIPFNLEIKKSDSPPVRKVARSIIPKYSRFPTVRFIAGSEFRDLTALSEQSFLAENFSITKDSNRIGFRLAGIPIHLLSNSELLSSAVSFGTIQHLPNGQLIVLMADHQTSGGYPVIGNIIESDLPLIAQLQTGDAVGFHQISIDEAEQIKLQFEKDLNFLKLGVRFNDNANN